MGFINYKTVNDMDQAKEKVFNIVTYGFSLGTFATNYLTAENLKGTILFLLTVYFLILQIRLHRIRIKNEKK